MFPATTALRSFSSNVIENFNLTSAQTSATGTEKAPKKPLWTRGDPSKMKSNDNLAKSALEAEKEIAKVGLDRKQATVELNRLKTDGGASESKMKTTPQRQKVNPNIALSKAKTGREAAEPKAKADREPAEAKLKSEKAEEAARATSIADREKIQAIAEAEREIDDVRVKSIPIQWKKNMNIERESPEDTELKRQIFSCKNNNETNLLRLSVSFSAYFKAM